ncbi:MAG: hypothetical protein M1812_007866 [Candelaria pacifica]|nr:MAG: hypothetical protein M1812_007866 [Candelaria pacifica]
MTQTYTSETSKVLIVIQSLAEVAETWLHSIQQGKRDDLLYSFHAFSLALRETFKDQHLHNCLIKKLKFLKQTDSVITYTTEFEVLIYQIGYEQDTWADLFMNELKDKVLDSITSVVTIDWHNYSEVKKLVISLNQHMALDSQAAKITLSTPIEPHLLPLATPLKSSLAVHSDLLLSHRHSTVNPSQLKRKTADARRAFASIVKRRNTWQ